ncbi:MAG: fasciclin domain-containing protein, partial [Actinomycetota bacterium]|nr:fasciclin domain-containing protein [Actinomycetota bacterium]
PATTTTTSTTTTLPPTTTLPLTTTTTTTPPTDPPQEGRTAWEILRSERDLSKARRYLKQAGLQDLLDDIEAPVTLLGPDNAAFELVKESPDGSALLDDKRRLRRLLWRHILDDRLLFADLFADETLETIGGDVLAVDQEHETIEDADVVAPDLEDGNGVIHAIDLVLVP